MRRRVLPALWRLPLSLLEQPSTLRCSAPQELASTSGRGVVSSRSGVSASTFASPPSSTATSSSTSSSTATSWVRAPLSSTATSWVRAPLSPTSTATPRLRAPLSSTSPPSSSSPSDKRNVDPREVSKFDYDWWDPSGPAAPLHALNSARVGFIRGCLEPLAAEKERKGAAATKRTARSALPLAGLRVLDVGCGGGILSEPLARLGAHVTGIDAGTAGPEAAKRHASGDVELSSRLRYLPATSLEDLLGSSGAESDERHSFDCVVASEVIEHVPDPSRFFKQLELALRKHDEDEREENKPFPVVVVSTLARTPRSWLAAIAGAERLAGLLPVGTHEWERFLNPEELSRIAEESGTGLEMDAASGMEPDLGATAAEGARDPVEAAAAVAAAAVAAAPSVVAAAAEGARALLFPSSSSSSSFRPPAPASAVGALFGRMKWKLTDDLGVNYIASFRRRRRRREERERSL